ncbi:hypothetical protein LTR78_009786 [Recurvomyces mirabilis]|uniref:Phosphatidate phosphatase APP1 catalytic domain-containing protein n=1 Tax=Recurvomyces mirabilis TaxID=574656 RepID=A0AAE0TR89_9PEZI|nr:hypothetical protein LTR78_009786 [Recurvomyces mirabilis]KAK5158203.1 hypothetical protein LTS14_003221 [Recurvomyces mirabilis]
MAHNESSSSMVYSAPTSPRIEALGQGSRRKKFAGYLKAANEMRQSYFSGDNDGREAGRHHDQDGPGYFADAAVVRSGNEELILFPSYARKHVKSKLFRDIPNPRTEQEYWQKAWEKHEEKIAILDVDVRGWVYVPHRGPHTRRQRLAIGALRQFAGIPAPPASRPNEPSSRSSSPERLSQQEEDLINLEAEKIVQRGEMERRNAQRGVYTEDLSKYGDADSLFNSRSRTTSPDGKDRGNRLSTISTLSSESGSPIIQPLHKRASWAHPGKMTAAELTMANSHLLQRAKPFMHNGLQNSPVKLMFYGDADSREMTVYTDPAGHFTCRAALEFTPSHVRVLATDKLSTTEEVHVIPPQGVSLISDIDDTVKHSAISAGIAEVVRNAFIRELGDLTIEGVREWYNTMFDMGVKLHYVSNSPWQMYPILTSYFKMAHLPRGTFHLKHYNGILAGIFEPVAERKKSSIDKILRDFPDRKFILVGDSGEADLEVYTDTAMENPGRVIGIFIRDVTTTARTGYFDSAMPPSGSEGKRSRGHSRQPSRDTLAVSKRLSRPDDIRNDDADLDYAIAASLADMEAETRNARRNINPDTPYDGTLDRKTRPPAPKPRRTQNTRIEPERTMTASPEQEDLIDLSEPVPTRPWLEPPLRTASSQLANGQRPSPSPPPKPESLRSPSPNSQATPTQAHPNSTQFKLPPPRPRKPSSAVKPLTSIIPQTDGSSRPPSPLPPPALQTHQPSPLSQVQGQDSPVVGKARPPLPARPKITQRLATAAGAYWHGSQSMDNYRSSSGHLSPTRSLSSGSTRSMEEMRNDSTTPRANPDKASSNTTTPPPLPIRRNISGYPFSRTRSSNRLSGGWDLDESGASSPGDIGIPKKEILWMQRLAKARRELEPKGVTVRTWKVGQDVADICVRLAEMEMRRIEREGKEG